MYGYNYGNGYPALQSGLGQQWPYSATRAPQSAFVKGRVVSNVEEARAAQIDFDGSVSYFPCPADNCIYAKSIGMDGAPVFIVYEAQKAEAQPQYADRSALTTLQDRVEKLEMMLRNLGGEHNATSANNSNDTKQRKPWANDGANGRQ